MPGTIYTIGHSTRPIDEFLDLLISRGIQLVADVRSIPGSDRYPQYNAENLAALLEKEGIAYEHIANLGGLRKPKKNSENAGWRNASFRGYADYMQTPDFAKGLDRFEKIAAKKRTAIMCAEAVPWRCHRNLIADALTVKGWEVLHIISGHKDREHHLTSFLRVHDGKLSYPKPDDSPD
jgi:uncharacterized protein (DUF488 family)